MPYTAQWDALNGVMIVGGTVAPAELPAFLRALQEAVGTRGAPTKSTDPIGPAEPGPPQSVPDRPSKQTQANWWVPFMELAVRANKMIFAIKFWRIISGQGLKEAKEYVEAIQKQKQGHRRPVGNEFPNVSKEDLAWAHEVLVRVE